ncbi:TetR family transcriptional regulator [Nocardia takedensis]
MSPESSPMRADAARNRRAILDATAALLVEFGYENVTMDAVAAAAGVGKGTIFHRFGSRSGLMRALALEDATTLRDAVSHGPPPLGPGADPAQRLVAFFDRMAAAVAANIEIVMANADTGMDAEADTLHATWREHVTALLADARPDADAEVLAELLLNALTGASVTRLIRGGRADAYREGIRTLVESVAGRT